MIEFVPTTGVTLQIGAGHVTLPMFDIVPDSLPTRANVTLSDGRSGAGVLVEYIAGHHLTLASPTTGQQTRYEFWMFRQVTFGGNEVPKPEKAPAAAPKTATAPKAAKEPAKPQSVTASSVGSANRAAASQAKLPVAAPATSDPTPALSPAAPEANAVSQQPLSSASQAAMIRSLMSERAAWQSRNTGLLGPVILSSLGGVAVLIGTMATLGHDGPFEDSKATTPGLVTLAAAGTVLIGATVLWMLRTSDERQSQELQRIDNQLRVLGVQANITPWLLPRTSQTASASGGLQLSLRY